MTWLSRRVEPREAVDRVTDLTLHGAELPMGGGVGLYRKGHRLFNKQLRPRRAPVHQ